MSLVAKDEVNKGLFNPSVKCDVSILLDDSLLVCVRDCEGDSEGESEGESEGDCEGDNEGDCEEVGEGDGEEIAGSSVNDKRDYSRSVDHELKFLKVVIISARILYIVRVD